jgi:hypothetical protein
MLAHYLHRGMRLLRQLVLSVALGALAASASADPSAPLQLSAADEAAAFRAAGFTLYGRQWSACGDPGTAGYTPGAIEQVADLNGDGRPEAVLSEGSSYCFGAHGTGYSLVSKRGDGKWALIDEGQGIPSFLTTRGAANWPDMQVGGPGFCFPVMRWDGREYVPNRFEYEGKRCTPPK